jgi:hypothetical protein
MIAAGRPRQTRRPSRPAAILIVALVTLLVVSSLVLSMVKRSLDDRRQLRREHDLQQVELLVDAGLRRAAIRLAADADFDGETWDIPAAELNGHSDARVVIEVAPARSDESPTDAASTEESSEDEPAGEAQVIRVAAEYPFGSETSMRRTRTVTIRPQSDPTLPSISNSQE